MKKRFIIYNVVLISFLLILSGCGGSTCGLEDATITINPSDLTVNDEGTQSTWDTSYFTVVVKDKNGVPLNDVEISIFYPWAVPSSAGHVQLYDGDTTKDSPMTVKTDEYGEYNLRFDYGRGGGLDYYGDFEVRSCSIYGSATFTVTAGGGD